jgi:hypothetical protein
MPQALRKILRLIALTAVLTIIPSICLAIASNNIPLDSPVYLYIEKLSGFGLITGDFKGIRPYSRSEAARLLKEAEERLQSGSYPPLASEFAARLRELLPREVSLRTEPGNAPFFDWNLFSNARLRYVYLDGAPRNYARPAGDPGGDWIFPLPQGRSDYNPPRIVQQRGSEGTPLMENNEGIAYGSGSSLEARWSSEVYSGTLLSGLVEPQLLISKDAPLLRLNKGYLKLGGGGLELEAGRDANWLGLGYRGAIILTDNAPNLILVKLSSPEPVSWKYLWDFKYDLIFSQLDKTLTDGVERQPFFYAFKFSMKPSPNVEFGLNLGRQVGGSGTGLDNSFNATLHGLIGATHDDNSNTLAGAELRLRLPWLGNTELYGEFSGEDRSDYWPMDDSYVAGFLIPRLSTSGSDDLRFEYFLGHQILYTNSTFPGGYLNHGFPIGHSQGGATQDFFLRYSHWFSVRNNLALECFYTTRGETGRVTVDASGRFDPNGALQAVERKVALRAFWRLPFYRDWDANLMYGWETIENLNLVAGASRTNQLLRLELSYRY